MTGGKNFAIAVEVYSNGGNRVSRSKQGKLMLSNPEGYFFRREVWKAPWAWEQQAAQRQPREVGHQ